MTKLALSGAFTALVTPFTTDLEIDWPAFDRLVEGQIDGGISGLVPCGTTGETPTLTDSEQLAVIKRTVEIAKGRVPVMPGTGSFSTKKTIEASKAALDAGADAVMVVMPYYNKPSQEGMKRHVELVAKAVGAPVVLYNIPGRTGVELSVDTFLQILETCPNVVGVKDATGNVLRCQELLSRAGDRATVMSGDDGLTIPMMSVGARGVISVTSNVYPREVSECVAAAHAGHWDAARDKHLALVPVHAVMFLEPNPQAVKAALAQKGRMTTAVRPPMVEAGEATRAKVAAVMRKFEGA